ncbi:unnamed protein product [Tuber aestivum]|uniref:Uncharacterized protein n=1 Tax=Tuber aestivum TaxID=59557 RepID=A0A292PRZ9_9PEZI|nr:unnamed protein product [Tuber aestivum]
MSSSTHKSNPTKGTKNTTDPAAKGDQKAEFSGAVTTDSLAAESLRSGGDFSRGNPTGIIGITADNSTLNTTISGGKVCEIRGNWSGEERYAEAGVDRKKFAEVGASGGGSQADDPIDEDFGGRPVREPLRRNAGGSAGRSSRTPHGGSGAGRGFTKAGDGRHSDSGGEGGKGSKQSAGSGPTGEVSRAVPNTVLGEQVKEPGLDWSKIPKDIKPLTGAGSGEDPGRVAENRLVKQPSGKQGPGDTSGGIERSIGEGTVFDYLKSNGNA